MEDLKAKGSNIPDLLHFCVYLYDCVHTVEGMTKRRNELQQKLKHFPTDSLRARILKDTVVDGNKMNTPTLLYTYRVILLPYLSYSRSPCDISTPSPSGRGWSGSPC